jgi:hypothetical protein
MNFEPACGSPKRKKMLNIIDTKYQEYHFGWEGVIKTTLKLIETASDTFGISYDVEYTASKPDKWHHATGGPIAVRGNGSWVVNETPKVIVMVENYSEDRSRNLISMHVWIKVDFPIDNCIYDQTLGGRYLTNSLNEFMAQVAANAEK